MDCPNCGTTVNVGEKFCRACGTKIEGSVIGDDISNYQQANMQSNAVQGNGYYQVENDNINNGYNNQYNYNNQQVMQNNYNDDDLINAYIGKNADKIRKGSFSGYACFFGVFYTLYRKMWLLSAIWYLLNLIIINFLTSFSFLTYVVNIVISVKFSELYLKNVRENVEKIKMNNPDKSREELRQICVNKGGTTVIPVVIAIIVYILLMFIIIFATVAETVSDNANKDTINQVSEESLKSLVFDLPSKFEASEYNTDDYLSYSIYDDTDYCRLTFSSLNANYYDSETDYLNSNIYSSQNDVVSEINKTNVNGNTWYNVSVQTSYNTQYTYVALHNGYIYKVEFVINDDSGYCSNANRQIVNSLNFE